MERRDEGRSTAAACDGVRYRSGRIVRTGAAGSEPCHAVTLRQIEEDTPGLDPMVAAPHARRLGGTA
jgi:hypothetical protein